MYTEIKAIVSKKAILSREGRKGKVTQGAHYKSMRWVGILAGAVFPQGLWLIPVLVLGYISWVKMSLI